jgi:glycosyltransferase involved in cell wall biosynthesis
MSSSARPLLFEERSAETPLFSVCIPQYSRFPFLIAALEALRDQTERSFEVCISDDVSPEGRHEDVVAFLRAARIPFGYVVQQHNLRYDGNLRAAMALARGRFCLLMGNDDALADARTLERYAELIRANAPLGVVITDFADYVTGERAGRIQRTARYDGDAEVALQHFRNFSFVSGILLDRAAAHREATTRWDGSEMYQMYIGCRLIATGHALLEIAEPMVRKDIRIPNESVDSYARRPRESSFKRRELPFNRLGGLLYDAIEPALAKDARQRALRSIYGQILAITYPYWLLEYRRVQPWGYAVGVARGMAPARILKEVPASSATRLFVRTLYTAATIAALAMPQVLFTRARAALYRFVKRPGRAGEATARAV